MRFTTIETAIRYFYLSRYRLYRTQSSVRIGVEHAIGGVKKYRIVKETFKCRKFDFQHKVMLIACGLHNFTISLKTNAIAI